MKKIALSLLLLIPICASGQTGPQVRLVSVRQPDSDTKRITVESSNGTYVLECQIKAAGCMTPVPEHYYRLVTAASTEKPDLAWIKEWYVDHTKSDTVGLVPAWAGWDKKKDFMDEYKMVGAYALVSYTAKAR